MKRSLFASFLIAAILLLVVLIPVSSQSGSIIISGADDSIVHTTIGSSTLNELISAVSPRIVIQYANDNLERLIPPFPAQLDSLLEQIADRIVIQYANDNNLVLISPLNSTLGNLLSQLAQRIVIQYANDNRLLEVDYPGQLTGDNSSPQISNVSSASGGSGARRIQWTTNEYALCSISYGLNSDSYTHTLDEDLYNKDHDLTLRGLVSGETYYYRITCTDRAGNTGQSAEYTFDIAAVQYQYIPLIIKR